MTEDKKYEVKKHGFTEETHETRKDRERERKKEIFMGKVAKLELEKVVMEIESLKRASYLAPHQRERKHFLEQALVVLQSQNDAQKAASDETAAQAQSSAAQETEAVSRKRVRDDDSDEDADDLRSSSVNNFAVDQNSAWGRLLAQQPDVALPTVVSQPLVTRSGGASIVVASKFVPRAVKIAQQQKALSTRETEPSSRSTGGAAAELEQQSSVEDADVNQFLDSLL